MAETTHLICAHCGGDNVISNYIVSDGTLQINVIPHLGTTLTFKCRQCRTEYNLPFAHVDFTKKG